MRFKDRKVAGQFLAQKLEAYANRQDVLVLALPRGGVPVAFEIAKALNVPLDVFVVRKLGVPGQKELAMGAIASGGVRILNDEIVCEEKISVKDIDRVTETEQKELERRERLYRSDCPIPVLCGRTIILVDDGLATGATMYAAILALQKHQPAEIVLGVPVSSPQACHKFEVLVDKTICLATPSPFYSVGFWYENFPQTTDGEVCDLLEVSRSMEF
ncbi:MAG: phosphoribosyltransferase [Rhizonema sp. PD37]|nr:phosphoribosyltransferase [Rhizonema sp. PD37]